MSFDKHGLRLRTSSPNKKCHMQLLDPCFYIYTCSSASTGVSTRNAHLQWCSYCWRQHHLCWIKLRRHGSCRYSDQTVEAMSRRDSLS
ncbi:hypothetical protein ACOSQ3_004152 [Xanthoceras sorbifolium]